MQIRNQKIEVRSGRFLEEIIAKKREELQNAQKTYAGRLPGHSIIKSCDELLFRDLFKNKNKSIKLVAEIKFASPTNPHLGNHNDLLERARQYEKAGVAAISIITEKYFFNGDVSFVPQIKKNVRLPILQKDFIIDSQQIYEAQEIGSDAILLIARLINGLKLKKFVSLCFSLGIEPVVEINDESDLKKAITTDTKIIAVNARDLETFEIDVMNACRLIEKIPDRFIRLGFSGINSAKEVLQYKEAGASGILVGTNLMKAKNIQGFIKDLSL